MYFFGWGNRTIPIGHAGYQECHRCGERHQAQAALEYRFAHLFWLVGPIITRRYRFSCSRCGAEFNVRSPRLNRIVTVGNTRLVSIGPLFLIVLGGALLLLGPGDFSD